MPHRAPAAPLAGVAGRHEMAIVAEPLELTIAAERHELAVAAEPLEIAIAAPVGRPQSRRSPSYR